MQIEREGKRANASIDSAQQPAYARGMGTLYYGDNRRVVRWEVGIELWSGHN